MSYALLTIVGERMAEIHDRLRELLENSGLRDAISRELALEKEHAGRDENMVLADQIREARRSAKQLERVFQALVIDELPAPPPVTAEDLASIAISQLSGVCLTSGPGDHVAGRAYQRFVTFSLLELDATGQTYGPELFQLGEDWLISRDEEDFFFPSGGEDFAERPTVQLWASGSGFSLHAMPDVPWTKGYCKVFGRLKGNCSRLAFEQAHAEIAEIISSIGMTAQWCATEAEFEFEDFDLDVRYFTPISFLTAGDGRRVLDSCLSANFRSPATGEDELLDRLRNATILLSHADEVGSDPLAVALIFSAIEALVCEEDSQPTKQIKKHVPTLLVQDAGSRKSRERVMDKLYRIRCDVLHGRRIGGLPRTYERARIIAAAVIRAVVCWRDNQLRVGGETTWKELMDELNAASRKPSIVVGIPDLSELIPTKLPG